MASAFTPINNDFFSFITRINYGVDDFHYFKKINNPDYRRNLGEAVLQTLASKSNPLHYEMQSLRDRISQLGSDHQKIKEVWSRFFACISANRAKSNDIRREFLYLADGYPVDKRLGIFSDTDLVIFSDEYAGDMPKNGIKQSELGKLKKLYIDFIRKVQLDYNIAKYKDINADEFSGHIFHNIRILLSRPLGRELIRRIEKNLSKSVTIKANEIFNYTASNHIIGYGVVPEITYSEVRPCDVRSISDPTYIILAHELIHLLHELEGSRGSHKDDPDMPPYYTDPEEWRTIKGFCKCHGAHELSEESLRAEFNLFPRHTHLKASGPKTPPVIKIESGAKARARQDIIDAIPMVTSPVLDRSIQNLIESNHHGAVETLVKVALQDQNARKGKYLRCVDMPALEDPEEDESSRKKKVRHETVFSSIVEKVKKGTL
ncbi:MAG: type III secretion system effector protein [Parachlamydiales bacterium]|nr:type III secretion system effector protein [Parachlamydiales bacterium]